MLFAENEFSAVAIGSLAGSGLFVDADKRRCERRRRREERCAFGSCDVTDVFGVAAGLGFAFCMGFEIDTGVALDAELGAVSVGAGGGGGI